MDYAGAEKAMIDGPHLDLDAERRARADAGPRRAVEGTPSDLASLRSLATVRARTRALLERARRGESEGFAVIEERLEAVARAVAAQLQGGSSADGRAHGRLRHLDAGGRPRCEQLLRQLGPRGDARARALIDLVVPSVLLDAGAGDRWSYRDGDVTLTRSEGLAVASLRIFLAGELSRDGESLRTDAEGLARVTPERLGRSLQVSAANPLVGLEGRAHLLAQLGLALSRDPLRFGSDARPGHLLDWARGRAAPGGQLGMAELVEALLEGLAPIWPGRFSIGGVSLGDVWPHPALGPGVGGLVPLHKLTQWLALSLVEPLSEGGVLVVDSDVLTPLSDYRNGGLLLDLGALVPRDERELDRVHATSDPLIVEWRALTVALLDELASRARALLPGPVSRAALEAATWRAGREVAHERRPGGRPPLVVASDGTVF